MKHIYLILWALLLVFRPAAAQSFSYLNASTGSDGQFCADADSNIYMFHGNRLEAVDKHMNVLWAKTYGSISFRNILLSKTRSIYFSGGDRIGRLDALGNYAWGLSLSGMQLAPVGYSSVSVSAATCSQLYIDRNSNLIVTGICDVSTSPGNQVSNAFFMKLDTNGAILKFKLVNMMQLFMPSFFSVVNDSAGNYSICALGLNGHVAFVQLATYKDAADSVTGLKTLNTLIPEYPSLTGCQFNKSKLHDNRFYVSGSISVTSPESNIPQGEYEFISAYNTNVTLWSLRFSSIQGTWHRGFDEDERGHVLLTCDIPFSVGYLALDSMGTNTGPIRQYISEPTLNMNNMIYSKANCVYRSKAFIDLVSTYVPDNPLVLGYLDDSLHIACTQPKGITKSYTGMMPASNQGIQGQVRTIALSSYSLALYALTPSPVAFSISNNFCTALGIQEQAGNDELTVYPVPCSSELTVDFGTGWPAAKVDVDLQDLQGRSLLAQKAAQSPVKLDVSGLGKGVYFLKISQDHRCLVKKIVIAER